MYGTVAKFRIKPGAIEAFRAFSDEMSNISIPGLRFQYAYQIDGKPDEVILVVGFESKEAYRANASSPEQHARYLRYREWLTAEPEWHDGEIVHAMTAATAITTG
jgi:quinol monooxygenase YgiN